MGNGFKVGGESMPGPHVLENVIAFANKAKGIESNSCPDIKVKNCTSINNQGANVAFYTNSAKNTDFEATGVISFRTAKEDVAENIKPVGSQDLTKIYKATNFYWDTASKTSFNTPAAGEAVTTVSADWFASLDYSSILNGNKSVAGIVRNADGTIALGNIFKLTDKAPAGVGADFSIEKLTKSSNPTIGGILTGTGLSASDIGNVYGVIKAYSSRVGEGPYVTELLDATGDKIRELGHEYGTTTGRPRRCGWLDLVTLKYAKRLNGLTALSVNHLDTIGKFDTIKVCTGYDVNGEVTEDFTTNLKVLNNAKPVYEELKGGWGDEIASCKTFEELPENAQKYISFIEKYIGVPVKFIGTGAEREAMIVRADN